MCKKWWLYLLLVFTFSLINPRVLIQLLLMQRVKLFAVKKKYKPS